jgi:hypothetical protein
MGPRLLLLLEHDPRLRAVTSVTTRTRTRGAPALGIIRTIGRSRPDESKGLGKGRSRRNAGSEGADEWCYPLTTTALDQMCVPSRMSRFAASNVSKAQIAAIPRGLANRRRAVPGRPRDGRNALGAARSGRKIRTRPFDTKRKFVVSISNRSRDLPLAETLSAIQAGHVASVDETWLSTSLREGHRRPFRGRGARPVPPVPLAPILITLNSTSTGPARSKLSVALRSRP